MGKEWGRNLASCELTEIVGWIDIRPGAAESAAEALGLSGVHTGHDLEQALTALRPDFVVDVTVPQAHHAVTLQSLKAGVPVLGEKPMASTMQQAREMVRVSEETGKLYMVSQNRRYTPRITAYRNLVQGSLGNLGILDSDFYIGAHFGGFRDEMPSPLILDMAIHTFDQARFIIDADPVSVYCEEFNPQWSWYSGDACAVAMFEMSDGLRYTYRGSWCSEGLHTSWDAQWRAVGSKGSATWDGSDEIAGDVLERAGGFHSDMIRICPERPDFEHEGIAASLRDFLAALNTGEMPMGECHDNIKSLAMVFGCIESSRRGCRVIIEDILSA